MTRAHDTDAAHPAPDLMRAEVSLTEDTMHYPEHTFSLAALLQHQIARGARLHRAGDRQRYRPKPQRAAPTSVRLDPNTLDFLHSQAAALNTSLQAVISMILDGVARATDTWAHKSSNASAQGGAR